MTDNNSLDIVFIYPPISINERYGKNVGIKEGHQPPLGLASLAAYLLKHNFTCAILDSPALNLSFDDIINFIVKSNPKVIGVSSLTSTFSKTVELCIVLQNKFPDKLIILGGVHATILPVEIMHKLTCFDMLVFGEGELTLLEIMQHFRDSGYMKNQFIADLTILSKIKGIVYRNKSEIVMTACREPIPNLDVLPYQARELLPMDKYIPLPNQYKRLPSIPMICIRGCPFRCTFCSNPTVFGRTIRLMSPHRVIDEIKHLKEKYGVKEISFWDDTLTAKKDWLMNLCDLIMVNNLDITWTCYGRVNTVDEELLTNMAKAGCWNIFYGVEAGNQKLLDNIRKCTNLDMIKNAISMTKKIGIEVRASFMLALPGETPELAKETIAFAKELNPDYAQFHLTTPYPGTELYSTAANYGILKTDFSKYTDHDVVFLPYAYKDIKELKKIEKKAYREFYFRLDYIIGRIKKIKSVEDIIRYIKGLRFIIGFTG